MPFMNFTISLSHNFDSDKDSKNVLEKSIFVTLTDTLLNESTPTGQDYKCFI